MMNENYRPIFPSEKKIWKLRHEPRGYEYKLIPLWQLEGRPEPGQQPEPEEEKMSVLGFLALVFLSAILDLPEPEGSAIDGEGK